MLNSFKHTGLITLEDGTEMPYAFGPNQSAILCQRRGWEFWEHEEQVLPALYATSLYSNLALNPDTAPEQLEQAKQAARRCLFNDPVFVQDFYYSAICFGAELQGTAMEWTPAQIGALQNQEPASFLVALGHYAQMHATRYAAATARPTSAPKDGEVTKTKKKAKQTA